MDYLEQAHVLGDEGRIELRHQHRRLLRELAIEPQSSCDPTPVMRHDASRGIDGESENPLGMRARHLFDVHSPGGRYDEGDAGGFAID